MSTLTNISAKEVYMLQRVLPLVYEHLSMTDILTYERMLKKFEKNVGALRK